MALLSFDAWGTRQAGSWSPEEVATPALALLRDYALTTGFTGHEQDEAFGLVNMKKSSGAIFHYRRFAPEG